MSKDVIQILIAIIMLIAALATIELYLKPILIIKDPIVKRNKLINVIAVVILVSILFIILAHKYGKDILILPQPLETLQQ